MDIFKLIPRVFRNNIFFYYLGKIVLSNTVIMCITVKEKNKVITRITCFNTT